MRPVVSAEALKEGKTWERVGWRIVKSTYP